MDGCVEAFVKIFGEIFLRLVAPWLFGLVFLVAGIVVLVQAPGTGDPLLGRALGVLLLYTSALCVVGLGFGRGGRPLATGWIVLLLAFLGLAAFRVG